MTAQSEAQAPAQKASARRSTPGASSKGLRAEINALRSKVNDIQHAAILLVLVVVAGAAYYCRPLKK